VTTQNKSHTPANQGPSYPKCLIGYPCTFTILQYLTSSLEALKIK